MTTKKYETQVIIDAKVKGYEDVQRKTSKLNKAVAQDLSAQAKAFTEVQKQAAALDRILGRVSRTFKGSGDDIKKYVSTVMKEFAHLGKADLSDIQKQIEGLQENLGELYREQVAVGKVMLETTDKASPGYEKLKEHMKALTSESKDLEQQIQAINRAYKDQFDAADKAAKASQKVVDDKARAREQSKGAFLQGMAQGGLPLPAAFLQRGPGMGRQMAGMMLGRTITGGFGAGRAIGSGMFSGVQGMAAMLSAIPVVGGAAAGQFMRAAALAEQNVQWQQTKLGLIPYMEDVGTFAERRKAREAQLSKNKAVQQARDKETVALSKYKLFETTRSDLQSVLEDAPLKMEADIAKAISESEESQAPAQEGGSLFQKPRSLTQARVREISRIRAAGQARITGAKRGLAATQKAIDKQIAMVNVATDTRVKAEERASKSIKGPADPFASMGELGVKLMGTSLPETAQFLGALARSGGSTIEEARKQDLAGMSMAAQTLYGIGPEMSGAFLKAKRRGGIVGDVPGTAGEELRSAIAQGFQLGLSRTERSNWMQRIGEAVESFEMTGVPINPKSITVLAGDISRAGISTTRALNIAQGVTTGIQQIGTQGVQKGMDLFLMQKLTGYTGKGGPKEYLEKRIQMEQLSKTIKQGGPGALLENSVVTQALKEGMQMVGSDQSLQALWLQQMLSPMTPMGITEADYLQKALSGGTMTDEQRAVYKENVTRAWQGTKELMATEGTRGIKGYEDLAADMVGGYAPGAQQQARLTNRQIGTGAAMVGVVMQLENMALNTTSAFNTLAGPTIKNVVGALDTLAEKALKTASALAGGKGVNINIPDIIFPPESQN